MAYQQSDLDQIRACIVSGVLSTRFADGREVKYQSIEGLLAAEQVIKAELDTAAALTRGAVARKFATFRSGF